MKKLGIIKKIQLWIKGKNDAKNKRFQEIEVTTYEEKIVYPVSKEETVEKNIENLEFEKEKEQEMVFNEHSILEKTDESVENLPLKPIPQIVMVSKETKIQISAFILTELQKFKREREYLISHKIFRIRKQEKEFGRLVAFQKGINFLEKNLKDVKAQMYIKETEYKKKKERIELDCLKCEQGVTFAHQLKEYKIEMETIQQEYLKEQEKNYRDAIFLIQEEIRVLEQMQALLRLKKNYHFLCIRYYYQSAQSIFLQLPLSALTDNVLREIGELEELGDDYEEILKKAHGIDTEFKDRYIVSTIN